jgi:hypothetical protein
MKLTHTIRRVTDFTVPRRTDQCEIEGCNNSLYVLVKWWSVDILDPKFVNSFNTLKGKGQKVYLESLHDYHQIGPCEPHYKEILAILDRINVSHETVDLFGRVKGEIGF